MSDEQPNADEPGAETAPEASLARISWSICTAAFVLGAIALLIRNDYGYAIVAFVIAVGAALNLTP